MAQTISATDTELQKPVNAMFVQTFLRRAQQTCPYFMGTDPGQLMKQAGTATIKWRRIEQETPTVTALSELTTTSSWMQNRDADTPTFTDVTATVAKYGQFYIVNEEVDLYNPNGNADELVEVLGESAGRSLNMLQRDLAEDNSTKRYSGNVASAGVVHAIMTTGILDRVINELSRNAARTFNPMTPGSENIGTAPILSSYWAICHPDVAIDIAGLTGFTSVEKYGQQTALVPGEFGYYGKAGRGVRFVMSEDATVDADAGAPLSGGDFRSTSASRSDNYTTIVYGQNAYGSVGLGKKHTDGVYRAGENKGSFEMIYHDAGSAGAGDPFNEIRTLAWKAYWAGAVLNANFSRAILTAATNLSN